MQPGSHLIPPKEDGLSETVYNEPDTGYSGGMPIFLTNPLYLAGELLSEALQQTLQELRIDVFLDRPAV